MIPTGKEPAEPPLRWLFPNIFIQAECIEDYWGFPRRSGRSLGLGVEMYLPGVKPLLTVLMWLKCWRTAGQVVGPVSSLNSREETPFRMQANLLNEGFQLGRAFLVGLNNICRLHFNTWETSRHWKIQEHYDVFFTFDNVVKMVIQQKCLYNFSVAMVGPWYFL